MSMRNTLLGLLGLVLLTAPGPASAAAENGGGFIEIPGFGRIPLPPTLPPDGVEKTIPREAPKKLPPPVAEPGPKLTPQQAQAKMTDQLAARLKSASDSAEAEAVMGLLRQAFANTTSDTSTLHRVARCDGGKGRRAGAGADAARSPRRHRSRLVRGLRRARAAAARRGRRARRPRRLRAGSAPRAAPLRRASRSGRAQGRVGRQERRA